jgi:perosamine synthetase
MSKLALLGGKPCSNEPFPAYNYIGAEEEKIALDVLRSGNLSQFLGTWHDDFNGGPYVRAFEEAWGETFGMRHVISVNSATSGLYAAIHACGIGPGDEVIVSPYTMSASAVAPLVFGAVPVFADVDPGSFCLSPESIRQRLTPRTRAIIIVHLFGHPADMGTIMELARAHNLYVIEDCAQSPLAAWRGRLTGTIGHIGVYSLNYHKHVHTGEGGMVVTNDDSLAEKVRLIRNHGEAVADAMQRDDLGWILGFNFRLTEIQAAIGLEQLKKLPALVEQRRERASFFASCLGSLDGITTAPVASGCTHSYYFQAFLYDAERLGIHRNTFVRAVLAELPPVRLRENTPLMGAGYVRPLYLQPLYQKRLVKCSYCCPRYAGSVSYAKGICPVAEQLHFESLFTHEFVRTSFTQQQMNLIMEAYYKVHENISELYACEQATAHD